MNLLTYQNFFLVGIKGVGMTSLAQILVEANKRVTGSDVSQEFVTQQILDRLPISIKNGFKSPLPTDTDCVIYTAAHQAAQNPQVKQALAKKIPTFSQAEAVAKLFNQKVGLAVCGVGGKSTTSAMLTWILDKLGHQPSFSIGVGNIPGLNKTGQWQPKSEFFVIEADEYVINPEAVKAGSKAIPRFSFLEPALTICTNLKYDHPDVYQNFSQTKQFFNQFFQKADKLILNHQDLPHIEVDQPEILTFGHKSTKDKTELPDLSLASFTSQAGQTLSQLVYQGQTFPLKLMVPGRYNVMNALAAILASSQLGIEPDQAAAALSSFNSTQRRFEYIGQKDGIKYYDDYAHHPHQVEAVIATLNEWYPQKQKVVAFQPHTYSRTKALFSEFVESLAEAEELILLDIFSSAREEKDPEVSSLKLVQALKNRQQSVKYLKTIQDLADYCQQELQPGAVVLTIGAGDVYQVHDLIN